MSMTQASQRWADERWTAAIDADVSFALEQVGAQRRKFRTGNASAWLTVQYDNAREAAERGDLYGTRDAFAGIVHSLELLPAPARLVDIVERTYSALRRAAAFTNDQAFGEGWGLFDVDGRIQLQRIDSPDDGEDVAAPKFESDADAIIFVAARAAKGLRYHREALELVGALSDNLDPNAEPDGSLEPQRTVRP